MASGDHFRPVNLANVLVVAELGWLAFAAPCEAAVPPSAAYIECESRGDCCMDANACGADGLVGKNANVGDVGVALYDAE